MKSQYYFLSLKTLLILKNNLYKELGRKAKEYAKKFEWENILKQYQKIL